MEITALQRKELVHLNIRIRLETILKHYAIIVESYLINIIEQLYKLRRFRVTLIHAFINIKQITPHRQKKARTKERNIICSGIDSKCNIAATCLFAFNFHILFRIYS